jgi:hypothetical protein
MNKTVKKIVIYYTDGTYQEVEAIQPFVNRPIQGPFVAQPAKEPLPSSPQIPQVDTDIYKWIPGELGKWNYPPRDVGIKIVD